MVAILGIALLFVPIENLNKIAGYIGIAMILSGISEIVAYYSKEKKRRYSVILGSGIIAAMLGILAMFGRGNDAVMAILPIIFAAWIVSVSIPKIIVVSSKKAEGCPFWLIMLCLGGLGIVFGTLVLLHLVISTSIAIYSLAFMLISGGINTVIVFVRLNKKWDITHNLSELQKARNQNE